jgi:predicted enzyme related to lactoylglutathione lyase
MEPTMSTSTTTTKTGLGQIGTVCVPMGDQDAAIAFYVETLGLELRSDDKSIPGMRWIEVGVPGQTATISLAPPPEGYATGGMVTGVIFETADVDAVHATLTAAGVDVDPEVTNLPDPAPRMFWFRDHEKNVLMVAETTR